MAGLPEASREAVLEYAGQKVGGAIAVRLKGVCANSGAAHGACALPLQPLAHTLVAEHVVTRELDGRGGGVLADGTLRACTHMHWIQVEVSTMHVYTLNVALHELFSRWSYLNSGPYRGNITSSKPLWRNRADRAHTNECTFTFDCVL